MDTIDGTVATTSTTSADGTTIGWRRSGEGPPAVLLHGTSGNESNWALCSRFLAPHHTLLAVDRRGRGRSNDGPAPYRFEQEIEDVAAVVATLDEPPHLIGHSYGAVVALAAANAGVPVRSLVLYEPPLLVHDIVDLPALRAGCEAAIDSDDPEGCIRAFYGTIGEGAVVDLLRTLPPVWELMLRDAHTIPRELRASDGWSLEVAEDVRAPTLLVLGTESHELFPRSIEALRGALPQAEVALLEGQGHTGHAFAPELFAQTVLDFLTRH